MIYLLHGENEFEKRERLRQLLGELGGDVERVDGEELETGRLRELLQGQTLFGGKRVVLIAGASEGPVRQDLPIVAESTDISLILVEAKLDKRSKTYKWLVKQATVELFTPFGERDGAKVVQWCVARAKKAYGLALPMDVARMLVERLGHDQLRLDAVLEQLSLAETVDAALVEAVVPLAKMENVFGLMEAALSGRVDDVQRIVRYLEESEGDDSAYMTMGLLVSQVVSLNALVLSGGDSAKIASDFGVHPFVLQKLSPLARNVTTERLHRINRAFSYADEQMKHTSVKPWLLVEMALVEIG